MPYAHTAALHQLMVSTRSLTIFLGWRRGTKDREEKEILSLFADDPRAPYSIHSFVRHGATACGKYPGEWFGPSATARCIQSVFPPSLAHRPTLQRTRELTRELTPLYPGL